MIISFFTCKLTWSACFVVVKISTAFIRLWGYVSCFCQFLGQTLKKLRTPVTLGCLPQNWGCGGGQGRRPKGIWSQNWWTSQFNLPLNFLSATLPIFPVIICGKASQSQWPGIAWIQTLPHLPFSWSWFLFSQIFQEIPRVLRKGQKNPFIFGFLPWMDAKDIAG